ncbi:DUF3572 domain-containing protein [Novosphingobium sp. ERN07]|nr:DUF3572 domain-containing protein [Novosphingobium sp. ERN07]
MHLNAPYAPRKALTIIREPSSTPDVAALALQALGWVLSDGDRAERFLGLTGLTPDELRAGLGDSSILAAVLEFLANHEADLVNAAFALDISPEALIAAQKELS